LEKYRGTDTGLEFHPVDSMEQVLDLAFGLSGGGSVSHAGGSSEKKDG